MNHDSVEYWVRQAQSGNTEAFNQLAEAFQSQALREAVRWLGDKQQAEDATQDAFIAAYKNLHQLRQPGKFSAWFRQIVRSQCNLQTRKKQHSTESIHDKPNLAAPTPTPENIIERKEQRQTVRDALNSLPEHEQVVAKDFYIKGKKQSDIADKLGIPVATVKKRLQYARKKLKGLISELTIRVTENFRNFIFYPEIRLKF